MDRGRAQTEAGPPAELAVGWRWILASAAALLALWALDLLVLQTGLLAKLQGQHAATPLYAYWRPRLGPAAWVFPLSAAAALALLPRLCDPGRASARVFAPALALLAALLAWSLYLVRDLPPDLGAQFNVYRDEEFWHDALRVRDTPQFLAHYVDLMPHLSTHGRHFPPGHTLLLVGVIRALGPSPLAAGLVVLALSAAAVPLVWLALRELASERAARQGALLFACVPSFLDFTCVSMDAVFLLFAALALWLGLRAFGPRGTPLGAALAGAALLVATCFSFSTFPLGLALAAYALLARRAAACKPLAIAGAAYVALALALRAATGFALWDCLLAANQHAHDFMGTVRAGRPHTDRARIGYGNAVAFLVGAGAATSAALGARLARDGARRPPWRPAALLTLAVMAFGPLYYMETERIWLFAMPWLLGALVCDGPLDPRSLRRVAAALLAQAFLADALLLTIW